MEFIISSFHVVQRVLAAYNVQFFSFPNTFRETLFAHEKGEAALAGKSCGECDHSPRQHKLMGLPCINFPINFVICTHKVKVQSKACVHAHYVRSFCVEKLFGYFLRLIRNTDFSSFLTLIVWLRLT